MNDFLQILYMSDYLKRFLLLILIIFVFFSFFGGKDQFERYLASLSGVITAFVTINPLEVNVSAPAEVQVNKFFRVGARIINKGEEKIENGKAEIFLPPEIVLIGKDSGKKIKVIPGKGTKRITWSVKGEKVGSYIITVSVSGQLKGEIVSAEDTTLVEVKEFLPQGRFPRWLQDLFDFFRQNSDFDLDKSLIFGNIC